MRPATVAAVVLSGLLMAACGGGDGGGGRGVGGGGAVGSTAGAGPAGSTGPGSARFWPYVDVGLPPAGDLVGAARRTGVSHYTLAFVTAAGRSCAPAWGAGAGLGTVAAQVRALRARGGGVRVSFGGRDGHELATVCRTVTGLRRAYQAVLDQLGPAGLDFDLEGAAVGDRAANRRRWAALTGLRVGGRPVAVSLTLPVIPAGLDGPAVAAVRGALAAGVRVSVVNLLAMDYGDGAAPAPRGRMGAYAERALRSSAAQLAGPLGRGRALWARLGATPMIGVNDVADEVFGLADARSLVAFGRRRGLGLLSMWSAGRDRPCPAGRSRGAQPTCSGVTVGAGSFSSALHGIDP